MKRRRAADLCGENAHQSFLKEARPLFFLSITVLKIDVTCGPNISAKFSLKNSDCHQILPKIATFCVVCGENK